APGKWVLRAYRSDIDDSIQPYAVLLPHDYGKDPKKKWRLDIVLHGRDSSLTEAKFIATHGTTAKDAPKDLGYIQLEPYGRGNNAYRWAGETDVFEALDNFRRRILASPGPLPPTSVDDKRIVLRGFSMGGAGTWHIGLHRPFDFVVIGPGAGFTTTHGYVGNLPKELPDYQEKCLRIYDAVNYAENVFNVPVVTYSGEKDPQKKAADNIENALKNFKEPFKFTHLVAPDLEHKMPKDWQDKAETEYRKFADKGRPTPERVRFVTYTTRYGDFGYGTVMALDEQYRKAVVDGTFTAKKWELKTENVRAIRPSFDFSGVVPEALFVDGQKVEIDRLTILVKRDGKWTAERLMAWLSDHTKAPVKRSSIQGPIDDAFRSRFVVVEPTGEGWHPAPGKYAGAEVAQFAKVWDRYFRGTVPLGKAADYKPESIFPNLVLFGDAQSNPLIAKVLPKLPITWTKDKLVVNGVEYDPKTHVPVLIYPNPLNENRNYVVINSGHTFKEADLKGTNALLYPRLGDWAVIKPTPTDKDPAAYEVVAAGLFDENWQFPKKK
ncbi:MAG: hypothetical protein L0241_10445, partial [Planctomycetia bacterium]|nr:hypothetical protein [Planctomycetia bacterium]